MRKPSKFITSPRSDESKANERDFVSVVILGENHGHRMKSYGPISLVKVGEKTLLEKQIEAVKAVYSKYEIILCVGFESKKTIDFVKNQLPADNIRIVENQVHFNSNCCESARLCLNNTMNNKILIVSGGILLTPYHLSEINLKQNSILVQDFNEKNNFDVSALNNEENLESLCLGLKDNFWTEVLFLNNEQAINNLYSIISNPDYKNKFIFEAINDLAKRVKIKINKTTGLNNLIKIDNIKTLKKLEKQ